MRCRATTLLFSLALTSCSPIVSFEIPPEEGAKTIVIAILGDSIAVRAIDPEEISNLQLAAPEHSTIVAVYYDFEDEQLMGNLRPVDPSEGRTLPENFTEVKRTDVGGNLEWSDIDALPERLLGWHFEGWNERECFDNGGCPAQLSGSCIVPCPPAPLPDLPDAPALDCPAAWTTEMIEAGDISTEICWPPTPTFQPCGRFEAQFYGTSSCAPVGTTCPADWPTDLVGDVYYVRSSATSTGSGTRADPFSSIQTALDSVPENAVLALAKGHYQETINLPLPVTIVGACATETIIEGSNVVTVNRAAHFRNLSIVGTTALFAQDCEVTAEQVVIEGNPLVARLDGAQLTIRDSKIIGGEPVRFTSPSQVLFDRTVISSDGPQCTLPGARLDLQETVLDISSGLVVSQGCTSSITRALSRGAGFAVRHGSHLDVSDVTIRDAMGGAGLHVQDRALLTFSRLAIDTTEADGLFVESGEVRGSDLYMAGSACNHQHGGPGYTMSGLRLENGSVGRIERAFIDRHLFSAIRTKNAEISLQDVVVRGDPNSIERSVCVLFGENSNVTGAHLAVIDPHDNGILFDRDVSVDFTDITVFNTGAGERVLEKVGDAFHIEADLVALNRVAILDTWGDGLTIEQRLPHPSVPTMAISDLTVLTATGTGIRSDAGTGSCERFRVTNCKEVGLFLRRASDIVYKSGSITGNDVGVSFEADTRFELLPLVEITNNRVNYH